MKKVELEQGTQAWLDFRRSGIGASEIAAIAGIEGAFQKRSEVMAEKLGAVRELTSFQKRIFADGHEWEALVRENLNSTGHNFVPVVVTRDEDERYFASLDGIDEGSKTILEVKSVTTRERFEDYAETIPAHYMAQIQWQFYVTGYDRAIIAFVHAGEVVTREVEANPAIQETLSIEAAKFFEELDEIKAGSMPAPVVALESQDMTRLAHLKTQERAMKVQLAMVEEEVKSLAERILKTNNANRVESDRVTIQYVDRQGSIDYSKVAELRGVDLAPYRKRGSRFVQVNLKGGEA